MGIFLLEKEFYKSSTNSDGREGRCKKCRNKRDKECKQKPEIKAHKKEYDYRRNQKTEIKAHKKESDYKRGQRPEIKDKKRTQMGEWLRDPENVSRMKVQQKKYRQKPESKAKKNKRVRERFATDLNFRIAKLLRARFRCSIKNGQKAGSAVDDLTCSIEEFKAKVARFFKPGMSWEKNWGNGPGKWNLDHIVPLSWFDLSNEDQFKSAAHYSNYQPLWWEENLKKSDHF